MVLTGAKKREDIYRAFENIYPVLQTFRKGGELVGARGVVSHAGRAAHRHGRQSAASAAGCTICVCMQGHTSLLCLCCLLLCCT